MTHRACRRITALYATEEKCGRPRVDSPKPDKGRLLRGLIGRTNDKTRGGCRGQQLPFRRFERAFGKSDIFRRIDQTPLGDQVSFLWHRTQHFNLQIDRTITNPRAQRTVHNRSPSPKPWRQSRHERLPTDSGGVRQPAPQCGYTPLQPRPVSWAPFQRLKPVEFCRPSQPVITPIPSFLSDPLLSPLVVNRLYRRGLTS